jgi:AraC-like DNA-binding protein
VNRTTTTAYAAKINKVFKFIDEHLDEDLSVERLSQVANFSKYHFHRQFSEYTGISVYKYIQLVRLKHASYQLVFKEPLNKSWSSRQAPETVKYEAQNAGNIRNISKFCALKIAQLQSEEVPLGCNEVVGCLRGLNADHGLVQRFPKYYI